MRIALCLTGHALPLDHPAYRSVYASFISHLYGPNRHHDIDVFISTWTDYHYPAALAASGGPTLDAKGLKRLYQPVSLVVENAIPENNYCPSNPKALYYKIHACDQDRQDYQRRTQLPYDAIIHTRLDRDHATPLLVDALLPRLATDGVAALFTVVTGGTDFALGCSHAMTLYASLYRHQTDWTVDADAILNAHLNHHRLYRKEIGPVPDREAGR